MFPEKETSIKSNPAEMTGDANLGFAIPKVECQQADVAMAKKIALHSAFWPLGANQEAFLLPTQRRFSDNQQVEKLPRKGHANSRLY